MGNLKIFFFSFFFSSLSLYSQICTAGLCFYCCSLGNRFRILRWSWWTGPSQTSPFRTMRFCECLPWGSLLFQPPLHQGRGLFWGRGEGGEGEADGPWASLWSCPVLMPFFTPRFPELSTDYCPPNPIPHCSAEAGPDFELRLELYGACVEEEGALAGAPKRLATKLSSSLGRSSGKRVRASLDSAGGSGNSPILLPTPAVG